MGDPDSGWRGTPQQPQLWEGIHHLSAGVGVTRAGVAAIIQSDWLSFRTGWLARPEISVFRPFSRYRLIVCVKRVWQLLFSATPASIAIVPRWSLAPPYWQRSRVGLFSAV